MHDQTPDANSAAADSPPDNIPRPGKSPKRWPVLLVLIAMIVLPGVIWRQVWWGAPLSDDDLNQRLSQTVSVREVQHALEQLSKRLGQDPGTARPFYPKVVALVDHKEPLVRSAVAWLMGEDRDYDPFRNHLLLLVADEAPIVRYNAAAALARFGDASGRAVLREMLRPYPIRAAWEDDAAEGTLSDVLPTDTPVGPRTRLALVDFGEKEQEKILAPLGGRLARMKVEQGEHIRCGDMLGEIDPNADQVWASLRALFLVGQAEDLEDIERYLRPPASFPVGIARQAGATAAEIRRREGVSRGLPINTDEVNG